VTIQEKKCFKCEAVKPLEDFYKHPMMADGRVNKCKECNKLDVRENRKVKIDYYKEYDRQRANIDKRIEARRNYASSEEGKEAMRRAGKLYTQRYEQKRIAHILVGNSIRDKKLMRMPCEICGEIKSEAHHDDYSKPLSVRWLCKHHHTEHHNRMRAIERQINFSVKRSKESKI